MKPGDTLTFDCWKTGETYESTGRWFDDGAGYWDVKASCPHCGEAHWTTVRL